MAPVTPATWNCSVDADRRTSPVTAGSLLREESS